MTLNEYSFPWERMAKEEILNSNIEMNFPAFANTTTASDNADPYYPNITEGLGVIGTDEEMDLSDISNADFYNPSPPPSSSVPPDVKDIQKIQIEKNVCKKKKGNRRSNGPDYLEHRLVPLSQCEFSVNDNGTSRILVRDKSNSSIGRIYAFHTRNNKNETIYYCKVCKPERYIPVTVCDEGKRVYEAPYERHLSQCIPQNFALLHVEGNQIHRKPKTTNSSFTASGSSSRLKASLKLRLQSLKTNETRKRSKSPSFRHGGHVKIESMCIVPDGNWHMENPDKIDKESKLWIYSDAENKFGREFGFRYPFKGGYVFYCKSCKRITKTGQKAKAFFQSYNGNIVIKESKHYTTCKPYDPKSTQEPSNAKVIVKEQKKPSKAPIVIDVNMEEPFPNISRAAETSILISKPIILLPGQVVYYSGPTAALILDCAEKFGFEIKPLKFWTNIRCILEIKNGYTPSQTHSINTDSDSGFRGISLFLTGSEENYSRIRMALKKYFLKNFKQETLFADGMALTAEVYQETLVAEELTNLQLAIICQMIKIRIGVFTDETLELYGSWQDSSLPSMLLQKTIDGKFEPVLAIKEYSS